MLDHGAREVTAGFAKMKKDPGRLGFQRPEAPGDIVSIVSGEEVRHVEAEVCAGHRHSVATPQGRHNVTSMLTESASVSM